MVNKRKNNFSFFKFSILSHKLYQHCIFRLALCSTFMPNMSANYMFYYIFSYLKSPFYSNLEGTQIPALKNLIIICKILNKKGCKLVYKSKTHRYEIPFASHYCNACFGRLFATNPKNSIIRYSCKSWFSAYSWRGDHKYVVRESCADWCKGILSYHDYYRWFPFGLSHCL